MSLLDWDKNTFAAINHGMANPFFDAIMPLARNPFFWAPVYVFFAAFLIINFKTKGLYIVLFAVLTFALTDQISAHLLKNYFLRLRPCQDPSLHIAVRSLVPCGSGSSFPSAHATNHFGISVFLIIVLRKTISWITPFALIWAALVSFAQIYVGLHFPVDVIFGAFLGVFVGGWIGYVCKLALKIDDEPIIHNL